MLNMSENEELSTLMESHKVYMRRVESLKTQIQALLHIIDIIINENTHKLYHKTKFKSHNKEMK